MPILAKEAAIAAKKYFSEVVGDLPGLTLEEVKKNEHSWVVTFSYLENLFSMTKLHKILTVDENSGEVLSMANSKEHTLR